MFLMPCEILGNEIEILDSDRLTLNSYELFLSTFFLASLVEYIDRNSISVNPPLPILGRKGKK